jgi:hypothetical protein
MSQNPMTIKMKGTLLTMVAIMCFVAAAVTFRQRSHVSEVKSIASVFYSLQNSHLHSFGTYYTDKTALSKDLQSGPSDVRYYFDQNELPPNLDAHPDLYLKSDKFSVLLSVPSPGGGEFWILSEKGLERSR